MNLLLDTNVLIDYLGRKEPFFQNAQKIVLAGFFGDAKLWFASQSMADAFFILRKFIDSDRLQKTILKTMEVINPIDLTSSDLTKAASLSWPDLEDCLISLAAQKANADFLITRDKKGFERSPIPVMEPTAWLDFIKQERDLEYAEIEF